MRPIAGMSASSGIRAGQPARSRSALDGLAEELRHARPEDDERQPGHDLVGPQRDRQEPVQRGQHGTRERADRPARGAVPGRLRGEEARTAPTSMIPSIPRFSTPARSFSSAPSAASAIGVPVMTAAGEGEDEDRVVHVRPRSRGRTAVARRRGDRTPVPDEQLPGEGEDQDGAGQRRRDGAGHVLARQALQRRARRSGCRRAAPDRHDRQRVVAGQGGHDDPVVAEVQHQPVGVEPTGAARHLAGTGQTRRAPRRPAGSRR